jgi:hypothetical protein
MEIKKNGKTFVVNEHEHEWIIKTQIGNLTVTYNISKTEYCTEKELTDFVKKSEIF